MRVLREEGAGVRVRTRWSRPSSAFTRKNSCSANVCTRRLATEPPLPMCPRSEAARKLSVQVRPAPRGARALGLVREMGAEYRFGTKNRHFTRGQLCAGAALCSMAHREEGHSSLCMARSGALSTGLAATAIGRVSVSRAQRSCLSRHEPRTASAP